MTPLLDMGRAGQPITGLEIIDMHGHLGPYFFAIPNLDPASVVAAMDRIGVASTVVSHMRCMSADVTWGNDEVLSVMRRFPGRILGYAALWPFSSDAVKREVATRIEQGFVGIKIHNATGFPYTHAAYAPAYALAHERRLPILFHTWGLEPVFNELSRIASDHPDLHVILAHSGAANMEDRYVRMAREHANVHLDLSLSFSPRGLIERLVAEVGARKILWGSDVLFFGQAQQLGRVLGARITEVEKRQILSGNAQSILAGIRR